MKLQPVYSLPNHRESLIKLFQHLYDKAYDKNVAFRIRYQHLQVCIKVMYLEAYLNKLNKYAVRIPHIRPEMELLMDCYYFQKMMGITFKEEPVARGSGMILSDGLLNVFLKEEDYGPIQIRRISD